MIDYSRILASLFAPYSPRPSPLLLTLALTAPPDFACAPCGGKGKPHGSPTKSPQKPHRSSLPPPSSNTPSTSLRIRSPAGHPVSALTINRSKPGPTLRFHVGDVTRIHVNIRLAAGATSLHWHCPHAFN